MMGETHGTSLRKHNIQPLDVVPSGDQAGRRVTGLNISLQTGEEFSEEFLRERLTPRPTPVLNDPIFHQESLVKEANGAKVSDFSAGKGCASGHSSGSPSSDQQSNADWGYSTKNGEKMKFLCSFGGKIMIRPNDGRLRYLGGETRIMSIKKNVTFSDLAKKTSSICNQPHIIKYQLPGEDLDALISVSCDEDLHHMIEEYHDLERSSQRLRIFIVPSGDPESPSSVPSPHGSSSRESLGSAMDSTSSPTVQLESPSFHHHVYNVQPSFHTQVYDTSYYYNHVAQMHHPRIRSPVALASDQNVPVLVNVPSRLVRVVSNPQMVSEEVARKFVAERNSFSPGFVVEKSPFLPESPQKRMNIQPLEKCSWERNENVPKTDNKDISLEQCRTKQTQASEDSSVPCNKNVVFSDERVETETRRNESSPRDQMLHMLNTQENTVIIEDVTGSSPSDIPSSPMIIPFVQDEQSDHGISPREETETESVHESDFEETKADDDAEEGSFEDSVTIEKEAGLHGLQIIKYGDLEELQELGSGTYGTVFHGKWRGTDVAIKRIKKSCFAGRHSEQDRLTKDFWREAQILSKLHHPNIVALYGVVPDGPEATLATVTEFMVDGSLRHVLLRKGSLDRRKKLMIALDAAFGMEYLHLKNVVHFDLKCDNLLVNLGDPHRPVCKVGDFGLSRIKHKTLVSGGVRGTLPWMAPELLHGSSSRVSEKVDVFSFGITMWEMLTGEEPYANLHCGAIIGGIVNNTLRPRIPERCDPEWKKLMEECWSPDPLSRPTFTEITNRLRVMSTALQPKRPQRVRR